MLGFATSIALLLAFPFLFPDEFIHWSRKIRSWLRERRDNRMRQVARDGEQDKETLKCIERRLKQIHPGIETLGRTKQSVMLHKTLIRLQRRVAHAKKKTGAKPFDLAPDVNG